VLRIFGSWRGGWRFALGAGGLASSKIWIFLLHISGKCIVFEDDVGVIWGYNPNPSLYNPRLPRGPVSSDSSPRSGPTSVTFLKPKGRVEKTCLKGTAIFCMKNQVTSFFLNSKTFLNLKTPLQGPTIEERSIGPNGRRRLPNLGSMIWRVCHVGVILQLEGVEIWPIEANHAFYIARRNNHCFRCVSSIHAKTPIPSESSITDLLNRNPTPDLPILIGTEPL